MRSWEVGSGFTSGWCLRASRRYAWRNVLALAFVSTPNTSYNVATFDADYEASGVENSTQAMKIAYLRCHNESAIRLHVILGSAARMIAVPKPVGFCLQSHDLRGESADDISCSPIALELEEVGSKLGGEPHRRLRLAARAG